ncbi:thymidylate kinase-like isoform X2 [Artemia franciscana]|uniref:dTMP kinase n=1 Tax=Artemia franciscana TaxID=6661 RepID=A0AA88L4B7_ARTSF|nr:hypothetical protein QYM36_015204 [Artemia franciscana]
MSNAYRSTPIGKVCADYLQQSLELDDHAIHLMFSANRWELKSHILSLLKSGVNVIVDRYSFSGVAFSAAKQGMDMEWCKKPEVGLPKPDRVIFLDLKEEVQRKRGGYGGERYETEEMQKRVHSNYEKLIDGSWIVIDADKTPVDLHNELLILVKGIISEEREEEVGKLWV